VSGRNQGAAFKLSCCLVYFHPSKGQSGDSTGVSESGPETKQHQLPNGLARARQ